MTEEVNILRGALENVSSALDGIHIAEPIKQMADTALKEADKLKEEPDDFEKLLIKHSKDEADVDIPCTDGIMGER